MFQRALFNRKEPCKRKRVKQRHKVSSNTEINLSKDKALLTALASECNNKVLLELAPLFCSIGVLKHKQFLKISHQVTSCSQNSIGPTRASKRMSSLFRGSSLKLWGTFWGTALCSKRTGIAHMVFGDFQHSHISLVTQWSCGLSKHPSHIPTHSAQRALCPIGGGRSLLLAAQPIRISLAIARLGPCPLTGLEANQSSVPPPLSLILSLKQVKAKPCPVDFYSVSTTRGYFRSPNRNYISPLTIKSLAPSNRKFDNTQI